MEAFSHQFGTSLVFEMYSTNLDLSAFVFIFTSTFYAFMPPLYSTFMLNNATDRHLVWREMKQFFLMSGEAAKNTLNICI